MHPAPDRFDVDRLALFLDVDGTLLPIRDNPADVVADRELINTLERCSVRLGGAMALISGRSIAEVDRIFAPVEFPVAGAHGAELRTSDGNTVSAADVPLPDSVMSKLQQLVARHEGLLLEPKRGGASLHYRRAPELESVCRAQVEEILEELGDEFRLIAGKMVFEIAPGAHHKGAAIRRFLDDPVFAGRRPAFIGDDVTDEDGFRVVNDLDGVSIRVGDIATSGARYKLAAVDDVLPWLQDAILERQSNAHEGDPHF